MIREGVILYFQNSEVLERVTGLNSLSTLKRWVILIEKLSEHKFKRDIRVTGHYKKVYSPYYPIFSNDDIEKIQLVAMQKRKLGLEKAIVHVFGGKSPPISLDDLIKTNNKLSEQIKKQEKQIVFLMKKIREIDDFISDTKSKKRSFLFGKN